MSQFVWFVLTRNEKIMLEKDGKMPGIQLQPLRDEVDDPTKSHQQNSGACSLGSTKCWKCWCLQPTFLRQCVRFHVCQSHQCRLRKVCLATAHPTIHKVASISGGISFGGGCHLPSPCYTICWFWELIQHFHCSWEKLLFQGVFFRVRFSGPWTDQTGVVNLQECFLSANVER